MVVVVNCQFSLTVSVNSCSECQQSSGVLADQARGGRVGNCPRWKKSGWAMSLEIPTVV